MDGFTVKVSELHPVTTEEDLQKLFSPYGKVKVTFMDRKDGDLTLTAEVQLKDEETATRAVEEFGKKREPLHGVRFRVDTLRRGAGNQSSRSTTPPTTTTPNPPQ